MEWWNLHPLIAPLPRGFNDEDTSHKEAREWMDKATAAIERLTRERDEARATADKALFSARAADAFLKADAAQLAEAERVHQDFRLQNDREWKAKVDHQKSELAKAREALERWEQVTQAVRDLRGFDATWPDHGNAPLAITAGYALTLRKLAKAREALEKIAANHPDIARAALGDLS